MLALPMHHVLLLGEPPCTCTRLAGGCLAFVRGSIRSLDSGDRTRILFWLFVGKI